MLPTNQLILLGLLLKIGSVLAETHDCADDARHYVVLINVKLADGKWVKICAGTLVKPRWILTAAGCVKNLMFDERSAYGVRAAAGSDNVLVKRVVVHPKYDVARYDGHDVALLQLPEKFDDRAKVVALPKFQRGSAAPLCQKLLIVSFKKSRQQCGSFAIVPGERCEASLSQSNEKLFAGQFCLDSTIEEGTVIDAGGPAMCAGVQAGVITSKWTLESAKANTPIVYTDLRESVSFIKKSAVDVDEKARRGGGSVAQGRAAPQGSRIQNVFVLLFGSVLVFF